MSGIESPYTGSGFAAGTLVLTEQGEVPVERLAPGDLLVTRSGQRRSVRALAHGGARDSAVSIPTNCLGDGVPKRDLLVSADQALCIKLVTDALVPVDALTYKSTLARVPAPAADFWQIHLDVDDVILAEGLPIQSGPGIALRRIRDRRALEMVRAVLKVRAAALGWPLEHHPPLDLHLVVDGQRIEPVARDLCFRFAVPAAAADVWIVSEASVPRDVGASGHDKRLLGARLSDIRITDGLGVARTVALDDPLLTKGFHHHEGSHRWTDGCARLPPDLWRDCQESFLLTLTLASLALPRFCAPRDAEAEGGT